MIKKYDNTDIEKVSLHDCPLYGFVWDSSGITWKSELILFIDYIDEDGNIAFMKITSNFDL